jgi:hypothetical protein
VPAVACERALSCAQVGAYALVFVEYDNDRGAVGRVVEHLIRMRWG